MVPQSPHLEPASPSPAQVGVHRAPEGGALNIHCSQMLLLLKRVGELILQRARE